MREQASHVQRIQKTLEDANLKLASVLTDVMGRSGRAVLDALAAGETDPERLQALVGPRIKASPEAIRAALTGRPGPHHRFLLGLHLRQIDALAAAVAAIDAEVEHDLGPFREAVGLLVTIPGVGELTADVVLSEIGSDMSRFAYDVLDAIDAATIVTDGDGTVLLCNRVAEDLLRAGPWLWFGARQVGLTPADTDEAQRLRLLIRQATTGGAEPFKSATRTARSGSSLSSPRFRRDWPSEARRDERWCSCGRPRRPAIGSVRSSFRPMARRPPMPTWPKGCFPG